MEIYEFSLLISWFCLLIGGYTFMLSAKLEKTDCPKWVIIAINEMIKASFLLWALFMLIGITFSIIW